MYAHKGLLRFNSNYIMKIMLLRKILHGFYFSACRWTMQLHKFLIAMLILSNFYLAVLLASKYEFCAWHNTWIVSIDFLRSAYGEVNKNV